MHEHHELPFPMRKDENIGEWKFLNLIVRLLKHICQINNGAKTNVLRFFLKHFFKIKDADQSDIEELRMLVEKYDIIL